MWERGRTDAGWVSGWREIGDDVGDGVRGDRVCS